MKQHYCDNLTKTESMNSHILSSPVTDTFVSIVHTRKVKPKVKIQKWWDAKLQPHVESTISMQKKFVSSFKEN